MYFAYKLNKPSDYIQPFHTSVPNLNQSIVPCPVLTVASCPHRDFSGDRQSGLVFWSLEVFSTFCCDPHSERISCRQWSKSRCILEFPCFFYDPVYVGNLISGSSAFSQSRLYIWKFSVYVLLNLSLKDFECNLASKGNECNCIVILTFFGIAFLWDWNENWLFPVLGSLLSFPNFQICWHNECSTLTASSFKIWNSSAGILSPPPALFIGVLHFTLQDVFL